MERSLNCLAHHGFRAVLCELAIKCDNRALLAYTGKKSAVLFAQAASELFQGISHIKKSCLGKGDKAAEISELIVILDKSEFRPEKFSVIAALLRKFSQMAKEAEGKELAGRLKGAATYFDKLYKWHMRHAQIEE